MKKSYYCEKLEKTIHFLPDGVKYCCSCADGVGLKIPDFTSFNEQDIADAKNNYIEILKSGEIPPQCSGCVEYKERRIIDKIKSIFLSPQNNLISHIIVDHYQQCDTDCCYCSQKKMHSDNAQKYELLPVIQRLYEKKMINPKNLKVEFQGGNISMLQEFDSLMNEFLCHNCDNFVILTNFIQYFPVIEKLGWKSLVCVSLDCGCKETYKIIKNTDTFDVVVNNLKELRSKSSIVIQLKYIILEGINDNKDELSKFLVLAREIDQHATIILEFDYNKTLFSPPGSTYKVPESYYELFEFAEIYCEAYGLKYFILPHTKDILEKGEYTNMYVQLS